MATTTDSVFVERPTDCQQDKDGKILFAFPCSFCIQFIFSFVFAFMIILHDQKPDSKLYSEVRFEYSRDFKT